jgi:hypothetical protein
MYQYKTRPYSLENHTPARPDPLTSKTCPCPYSLLLAKLREQGYNVDAKVDESEYGKFGWVMDPECGMQQDRTLAAAKGQIIRLPVVVHGTGATYLHGQWPLTPHADQYMDECMDE